MQVSPQFAARVDALYETALAQYDDRRAAAEAAAVERAWYDFVVWDLRPQWELRASDPFGKRLKRPPRKPHDVWEYGFTEAGTPAFNRYYADGALEEEEFISSPDLSVVERVAYRHRPDGSVVASSVKMLFSEDGKPICAIGRSASAYGVEHYSCGEHGVTMATSLSGPALTELTKHNEWTFTYSPAGELELVEEATWDEDGDHWTNVIYPPRRDDVGAPEGGWALLDASAMHDAHPDTFWVPSGDEKAAVAVGDTVQLVFEHARGAERMWVNVVGADGDTFVGRLDNNPVEISELELGALIHFTADHIISING